MRALKDCLSAEFIFHFHCWNAKFYFFYHFSQSAFIWFFIYISLSLPLVIHLNKESKNGREKLYCCMRNFILTLLITKWRFWILPLHESTKFPGCDVQSRTIKSPSFFKSSSARCLGIAPWYHACERKSLESNDNSHSRAFFNATASGDWVSNEGDGDSWALVK
jgi:hypothetical protein